MKYSFMYRSHRIDVDLRPHPSGWQWQYDLHDGLAPRSSPAISESTCVALQSACSQARRAVDLSLSPVGSKVDAAQTPSFIVNRYRHCLR
jgi:hypothetical protein